MGMMGVLDAVRAELQSVVTDTSKSKEDRKRILEDAKYIVDDCIMMLDLEEYNQQ